MRRTLTSYFHLCSWVITCDQTGHHWLYSSDCGQGMTCIYGGGIAHCIQGTPPPLEAREEPDHVPSDWAPSYDCSPGTYDCAYSNETKTEWTIVCDQSGHAWQWSSNCGKGWKCVANNGVAHCLASKVLFEAWEAVQSFDLVTHQDSIAASTMATVVTGASASAKA